MIKNIIKIAIFIIFLFCSGNLIAQTQQLISPSVPLPVIEMGNPVQAPPVMVTGVTLSSPDDPVKIPGKPEQGRPGSSQSSEPNIKLEMNVPVIQTTEKSKEMGK